MSGINFDDWEVDLGALSATHASGFTLSVEGSPRNPSAVHPGPFPKHLTALEQVRLLRFGVEALAKAAKDKKPQATAKPASRPLNPNRPRKPQLSLKRRASSSSSED